MLSDGDRIAVGVSGGKDSLVLLDGLILLRNFIGIDYELIAVTVDPRFNGVDGDYSQVARFCSEKGVRYVLEPSHIGSIVFDVRKEDHPCSLCARMRRGALHNIARREGCNKLALGHHLDDAVETFLMNLFVVGRIGCFSPVSEPKTDSVGLIRPLALAREWEISAAARRNGLEAVRSRCPGRQNLRAKSRQYHKKQTYSNNFSHNLFSPFLFDRIKYFTFCSDSVFPFSPTSSKPPLCHRLLTFRLYSDICFYYYNYISRYTQS